MADLAVSVAMDMLVVSVPASATVAVLTAVGTKSAA